MKPAKRREELTSRTIRFPRRLRETIARDAERCGRSFEAQVIALLRHHYGADVDIAPTAEFVLQLATESLAGMSAEDQKIILRRLHEAD